MPREQQNLRSNLRSSSSTTTSKNNIPKWATILKRKVVTSSSQQLTNTASSNNDTKKRKRVRPSAADAAVNDDTVFTTRQEEAFLREMMYQSISKRVDNAIEQAIRETHSNPLVQKLTQFFRMVDPPMIMDNENEEHQQQHHKMMQTPPTTTHRSKHSPQIETSAIDIQPPSSTTSKSIFSIDPPTHYSPALLPIAIVHTPSSVLDRRYFVESVARGFQGSRDKYNHPQKRPAVCQLRCTTGSSSSSDGHGEYVYDILSQCISQESCPSIYASLLQHKKSTSAVQSLLTWAQHTETFHSLLILMENVEIWSIPTLQDFLQCMSSLRNEEGVPLCIVTFCMDSMDNAVVADTTTTHTQKSHRTRGIQHIRASSSTNGMTGWLVQECRVPSSTEIYNRVWELLWIANDQDESSSNPSCSESTTLLPIIIQPSILRHIRETFVNHISSAVGAAHALKQVVAFHLSRPGTYLLAATDFGKDVRKVEGGRVAWFCVDEYAREYFFSSSRSSTTEDQQQPAAVMTGKEVLQQVDIWKEYQHALRTIMRMVSNIFYGGDSIISSTNSLSDDLSVSEIIEGTLSGRCVVDSAQIFTSLEGLSKTQLLTKLISWRKVLLVHRASRPQTSSDSEDENDEWKAFKQSLGMTVTSLTRELQLLDDLVSSLNELIVLVSSAYGDDENDRDTITQPLSVKKDLIHLVVQWIRRVFEKGAFLMKILSSLEDDDDTHVPNSNKYSSIIAPYLTMPHTSTEKALRSMSTDLRKSLSSALLSIPYHEDTSTTSSVRSATCEMYRLLHNRIDISRQDWYDLFVENYPSMGKPEGDDDKNELVSKFDVGLYELMYCGLIRQKRGKTKTEMYEKAILVWCNGDK